MKSKTSNKNKNKNMNKNMKNTLDSGNDFKNIIRKTILTQRENLSLKEQADLSGKIIDNFVSTTCFKEKLFECENVSLFNAFKGEPDLTRLRDILIKKNVKCFYPITLTNEIIMSPYFSDSGEKQFSTGRLGIREPVMDIDEFYKMEVVFIPGIAFDITGNRIGFGKGYYDRYLSKYPKKQRPYTIALIYDFQLLDNIPSQNHDIPVNFIVTEKRIIETDRGMKID